MGRRRRNPGESRAFLLPNGKVARSASLGTKAVECSVCFARAPQEGDFKCQFSCEGATAIELWVDEDGYVQRDVSGLKDPGQVLERPKERVIDPRGFTPYCPTCGELAKNQLRRITLGGTDVVECGCAEITLEVARKFVVKTLATFIGRRNARLRLLAIQTVLEELEALEREEADAENRRSRAAVENDEDLIDEDPFDDDDDDDDEDADEDEDFDEDA